MGTLEGNREAVLERIAAAARRAGRAPGDVRLVAVTKTVRAPVAEALVRLGTRELGENRVDELERKHARLAERGLAPRWHFVGHVQRNKARRVVRLADEIHSVDSLRLVDALARLADEESRRPVLWLQAHLSGETTKTGFAPDELPAALERARDAGLEPAGLMTLAPLVDPAEVETSARGVFRRLAELARELAPSFPGGAPRLSMGMSGDFEAAIEAGADVVRVGTALFRGLESDAPGSPAPTDGRRPA